MQTNIRIPADAVISIPSVAGGLNAKVTSCEQDEYGFLVEFTVQGAGWYPEGYVPPHVMAKSAGC